MSRNWNIVIGLVIAALIAALVVVAVTHGSSGSQANQVVVFARVQTRNLSNTVELNGTLARKQIRNVTSANAGLLSAVTATDGQTGRNGQTLFAVNGHNAVAEDGTIPFFRPLSLGDQGTDVLQLKKILASSGDYPGPANDYFTSSTTFALAQWQAQHGYPNSTPATAQSVDVSLEQGTGYKLGAADSAGLTINPPPARTTAATSRGRVRATLVADDGASPSVTPPITVTIQSVATQVPQGQTAAFVVNASKAPSAPVTVHLTTSGTAGPQDIVTPPSTVTLEAGETAAPIDVQTRANTTVGADKTVVVSLTAGTGYDVGTPASATTTIQNENKPALTITGGTTVAPGGTVTLTITANQAPVQPVQISLSAAGSATPGTDYDPVNPIVTLPAGATTASVTITTLAADVIAPAKFLVVSLSPSPEQYTVTTPGSAVVTIAQPSALPTVTLTSATHYLTKGEPYPVAVSLSEAVSTPLTVHLSYGGTAVPGTDYVPPKAPVIVPAGQTTLEVQIPTVTNNTVEVNRVLTVSLGAGAGYAVGTPSTTSVTLNSTVVPTLTLSATSSAINQGAAATFTITASQPPVKNTSVSFAVEGTAEPGQSYVPLTGSALLAAGQSSVTVTVQSLQTNVAFEPTDMIVGQWPIRIGTVYLKAGAPVGTGEAILSLTEPELSVTLQATAAERSKLAVGQHCTVQISGANTVGVGTIVSLTETPTSVSGQSGQSQQVYEGRIEVGPNFTGADGSQVSITVTDQQVNNVLTVPIAAVLQNGEGKDVVRVISLSTGRITEVPVTTGISQGSYIEITKGLHLGQVVITQVNHSS